MLREARNFMKVRSERFQSLRNLTGPERWTLGGMVSFILLLHVLGWGAFIALILPQHFQLLGIGVVMTAYTLGMRHAFDADHISAIDNTTRKLMNQGQKPLSVGFWFSLGHSTIVFLLGAGLTFAARAIFGAVSNPHSALESFGGFFGTLVSGSFLYLIAILNLVILVGIVQAFMRMRQGGYSEADMETQLNARGFMYRIFGRLMKTIRRPVQMYLVGVLFGLGFDTATEVALLAATAGAATAGLPWYAVICLPVLFAAGMTIFDTMDGCFMNFAYGWAFARPIRKVYYNITITALSIGVAFVIGTIELLGLLPSELSLRGAFWRFMAGFNINTAGFFVVGMFAVTWAVSLGIWRFGRVEQRWDEAAARARASVPTDAGGAAVERA